MPITKATQNVITTNIVTTDTQQTITSEKVIQVLYDTTSTTSLTIGLGSKTLTVGTDLNWVAGRSVTIRNGTSTTRFMTGSVTSYNYSTGVMVVNVTSVGSGTGTYTSWVVTQNSSTALPALRITSNDSGANAFVVEDTTNPDASPFSISSIGNVKVGGNISGVSQANGIVTNIGGFKIYTFTNNFSIPGDDFVIDVSQIQTAPYRAYVNASIYKNYTDATPNEISNGGYQDEANINSSTNGSGGIGYTVNGTNTTNNFTTVLGSEPTIGGIPGNKYAAIQGTAASGATNGTLNLTLRGHTASDGANFSYFSSVVVTMIAAY
jgi:hypothetical protein